MDSVFKSVVFCGSVPLIVNGKRYEVQALPIREVIGNDDFQASGLYFPMPDEPVSNYQALSLENEQYRNALDKWLKRLLTLDGVPQGLEDIAAAQWTDTNIGEFLSLVFKSSGLTRKAKDSTGEQTTPEQWIDILAEMQYIIHASWNELVDMPLLRLDATRERILKQAAQDMQSRMPLGGLGGGSGQSKISADYDNFFADCRTPSDPRMGKTPQFKSRDEYFDMVNNLNRH